MAEESFLEWKKANKEKKSTKSYYYDYNRQYVKYNIKRKIRKDRSKTLSLICAEKPMNFLKYYMIMSYSFCRKNNISKDVFELLLYLYSEPPMTRSEINTACKLLPKKTNRLNHLIEKGLVNQIQPIEQYVQAPVMFYGLSHSCLRSIDAFYQKLLKLMNGVERGDINPIFWKNPMSVLDKTYQEAIIKMMNDNTDGFDNYKYE